MQLRVVTDQPWDVQADVLAIPVPPEPVFDGALGELDRRSGGELRAQAAFGELVGDAVRDHPCRARRPAGRPPPGGRDRARGELDRETVVHLGATIERRLGGRPVHALAIWLGDLAAALDGGPAAVAELLARGVVEGSFDPAAIYRAAPEASPPALDELILVAPGADPGRSRRPPSAASSSARGPT